MFTATEVKIFNMALRIAEDAGFTPAFVYTTECLDDFILATIEGPYIRVDTVADEWRHITKEEYDDCVSNTWEERDNDTDHHQRHRTWHA